MPFADNKRPHIFYEHNDKEWEMHVKHEVRAFHSGGHHPPVEARMLRHPKHACLLNLTDQLSRQFGVFAVEDISAGDLIVEYVGEVARESADAWSNENYGEYAFQLHALDDHVIRKEGLYANAFLLDAVKVFNEAALVNDVRMGFDDGEESSVESNQNENIEYVEVLVDGWPHVYLFAKDDIRKDEECFGDYMDEYWQKVGNRTRGREIKGLKDRIAELERELVKLRTSL